MQPGLTQGLRRAVQIRADRVAVIDAERRFTWHEFADRVQRLAGAFAALGVQPGDRVALLALNSHRVVECFFATLWAGGIVTPLSHRLTNADLAGQIGEAAPTLLILGADFTGQAAALHAAAPGLRAVIALDAEPPPDLHDYESLLASMPIDDRLRGGDDAACLFYTGGTTGVAKGVLLSHANIMANTLNFLAGCRLDEDLVHLHCGPFFHVAAAVRLFSTTQVAGTHCILPRFAAAPVLQAIAAHQVTLATFVPTMLRSLLDDPGFNDSNLETLRTITYGAAAMPEALLREALARMPGVRFIQSYGMTETSPIVSLLGWRDHLPAAPPSRLRSAGRAALLAEIRIVDQAGDRLPAGRPGEITVRGPMVMLGYWNRPDATADTLRGGWMHTGDIGYLDTDGYLYVVDRLKDVIISGGENIYSQEVENAIAAHPGVQECAVLGLPDAKWGETVHAVVVPKPGVTLAMAEIVAHCKTLIASYKCPRTVTIRTESLPLSGANKVLKPALRDAALQAIAHPPTAMP